MGRIPPPRRRVVPPRLLRGAVLGALCGAPALCGAAQTEPTDQTTADTTDLPQVIVTGSHIRSTEFETAQPLLVLDRVELERTGLNTVGEILQLLPQHVSDLNTDYNNGGNGETRVDLRNLGAHRTLVLLNGHRYVTALDGAVDVSSIPLPIVKRVEVLTDGASAIYGSDAIAGVVNIVTQDDYQGLDANMYYATNEHGDGERLAADLTWGWRGDRGSTSLNLSYAEQKPIWAGDRAISAVPAYGLPHNDICCASPNGPNGNFAFGPNGNLRPDGSEGRITWDPQLGLHRDYDTTRDGYNYAPENYLRTPYERIALFAQGQYELSPALALRSELLVHHRRSRQQLAPTPILQDGWTGDPNQSSISTDSVFNPFGQPVTLFRFRPINAPRIFEQDVLTTYLVLGADGAFDVGDRDFAWDARWIEARTDHDDSITGGYDLQRLGLGIGPSFVDSTGVAHCGTPQAPIDGCVPIDVLHGSAGFTDAMFEYIAATGAIDEERRLRDITFNVSGTLFELPAGPLSIAVGVEYRRERGRVTPDELMTRDALDFGGIANEPLSGEVRANEAYVELNIPVLQHKRWAHALDVVLAARYSDYSTFGSTNNGKLALSWRPTPAWLLRATWSEGYRAPSVSELFAVSGSFQWSDLFAEDVDPCVGYPEGIVAERCVAAGAPPGLNPQVGPVEHYGSNPALEPEQARNRTLGVVWSPPGVAGLDVTLDWWRIELKDAIDALFSDQLTYLCYVEGATGACDQLVRDPDTGVLVEIDARLHNYGRYEIEGYDLGLGYHWENGLGAFALRWDSVYLSEYTKEIPKGAPPISTVGNYFPLWDPNWRVRSMLSLDWDRANVGATARVRYYSSLDESCAKPADAGRLDLCDAPHFSSPTFAGEPEHRIDSRTYMDLQFRWEPWEGTRLALGVNNAFDRDPPLSYSTNGNSYDPTYDIPGRFWYLSASHRFR